MSIEAGPFEGPHEIHVTTNPLTTDTEVFRGVCDDLGVKAHIISNELPGGNSIQDFLTGSEFEGGSGGAFREMGRIAAGLEAVGLHVVRQKIETTPWHPNAPKTNFDRMGPDSYFECHFTLPDLPAIHRSLKWEDIPFLISTTASKRATGKLFATMRHYTTTAGAFCETVGKIHKALDAQLWDIEEPTVEFALYDSNPDHDKQWVDAYRTK